MASRRNFGIAMGFVIAAVMASNVKPGVTAGPVAASIAAVAASGYSQEAGRGEGPLKIVAFGTSLTARGGWQAPLGEALTRCLGREVEIATVARSGSTSDWALGALGDVVAQGPDIVLIEFYANDAALNRFMSLAHSRSNFGRILDELRRRLPRSRIIAMAMNPMHGMRGWIRPSLEAYIAAHRELALAKGAEFIDHRPAWLRLGDAALADAIPDGGHPRAEVAARVMVPELVRRIAGRDCGT